MSLGVARSHRHQKSLKLLSPGERSAKILAVAAQKGGVGKTTTAVSIASAWARLHGLHVLVVDLDPQANVSISVRSQILANRGGGALSEVLENEKRLEVAEIAAETSVDGFHVTPMDPALQHFEDRMVSRIGKELILRKALEITRTHYDAIVIDCPPHIGGLTVNALVAADQVLVPTSLAALSVSGVSGLLEAADEVQSTLNPQLDVAGVLLTRVDGRSTRVNASVLEMLDDSFGEFVLDQQIGVDNALARAQLAGEDIYAFAPTSRAAGWYGELARHLAEGLGLPGPTT
jgi:chromosome partitioning protein